MRPFVVVVHSCFHEYEVGCVAFPYAKERFSLHSGRAKIAARRGSLAQPECGTSSSHRNACYANYLQICFLHAIDQVLFSKLLLENTDAGTLLEWCKVNRGAFVVAR